MIPNTEVYKIDGSLGGEVTRMKLDQSALVHIMSVLTNLYSDTELAVIREYSTNALDSHIFAGQSRPIEITTPGNLSTDLIIQDFGLGLDKDDIQNVYGNYGASTKRESNDVAGCLGLGSKSALAYTNSFSVVGVKNGIKTVAVISRDEDGSGVIEVVDESETNEPNGVAVRVPSGHKYDFKDKVKQFFHYWPKDSVLINGEAPEHFTDKMTALDDTIWMSKPNNYGQKLTVVMGGVSYPVTDYDYTRKLPGSVVVMADMGDVDFVPSREALNWTPRTKEYVQEAVKYVEARYLAAMQDRLNAISSMKELLKVAETLPLRGGYFTWQGMRRSIATPQKLFIYDVFDRSSSKQDGIRYNYVYRDEAAILINKPFTPLSGLQRDKLEKYLEDNGLNYSTIYYFNEVPFLLSEANFIDFNEVNAVKIPKGQSSAERRNTSDASKEQWDFWTYHATYWGGTHHYDLVDQNKPVVILLGGKKEADPYSMIQLINAAEDTETQVVRVAKNRENTFRRAYPKAMTEREYRAQTVQAAEDKLTKDDWGLRGINTYNLEWLADKTLDTNLTAFWKANQSGNWKRFVAICKVTGQTESRIGSVYRDVDYIDANYPLINENHRDASLEYINFVYTNKVQALGRVAS